MLITGRLEANIKQWVMKVDEIRMASFRELEDDNQDVEKYIRSRLKDKASDIQNRVIRRAEGLFIWARIAYDLLSQAKTAEASDGSQHEGEISSIPYEKALSTTDYIV